MNSSEYVNKKSNQYIVIMLITNKTSVNDAIEYSALDRITTPKSYCEILNLKVSRI